MENAARAVREGGSLLYFAECAEGYGSQALKDWTERFHSAAELEEALRKNFVVGSHKAYWLARLGERVRVYLVSSLEQGCVLGCRFHPVGFPQEVIGKLLAEGGDFVANQR